MKKLLKFFLVLFFIYLLASGALAWFATSTYKPSFPLNTATLGFPVDDVVLETDDHVRIEGWYSRGMPNAPAILLVHGFRGTRSDNVIIARTLTFLGYSLLMIDTRGCGHSDGDQSLGRSEALDVRAGLQYLQKVRGHHAKQIGVVGVGTGASAVILANEDVSKVAAAVLLGPYSKLDATIEQRFRSALGVHAGWTCALAREMIGFRIGKRSQQIRPIDVIAKLSPCAVLLVGAGEDTKTPPEEIKSLHEAAAEPKELFILPGVPRERLSDLCGSDLKKRLLDFLGETLQ